MDGMDILRECDKGIVTDAESGCRYVIWDIEKGMSLAYQQAVKDIVEYLKENLNEDYVVLGTKPYIHIIKPKVDFINDMKTEILQKGIKQ